MVWFISAEYLSVYKGIYTSKIIELLLPPSEYLGMCKKKSLSYGRLRKNRAY